MTTQRLTLDPLRGLVAHNAQVFRDRKHRETVAVINQLRLDINYTRLLRKEPFLDALILSEADLNVDLNPKQKGLGETLIRHVSAEIYFHSDHFEIRRLRGEGLGLKFSITGSLEHALDWKFPRDPSSSWKLYSSKLENWLEKIGTLKSGSELGRLDVRLRGSLSQDQWLQTAEGSLEMPLINWKEISLRDVRAEFDWTNKILTLRKFQWRDARGQAALTGTWQAGGRGDFHLESTINGTPYFREIEMLATLAVDGRMQLQADILWPRSPATDWQIVGQVDARKPRLRKSSWDRLQTQFSVSRRRCFLPDFKLTREGDSVSGEVVTDTGVFQAKLVSSANPRAVWTIFSDDQPSWLKEADFLANPWIKFSIEGPIFSPADWLTEGEIVLGRSNFRGVAITSGQTYFQGRGASFSLNSLQITRPEGQLTAEAFWKPGSLVFWNVSNTIDLVSLGSWVDESLAEALGTVRLEKGGTAEGDGTLTWSETEPLQLSIQLRKAEIDLQKVRLLRRLAPFLTDRGATPGITENVSAELLFQNAALTAKNVIVSSGGTPLRGIAEWNLEKKQFTGQVTEENGQTEADSWVGEGPWEDVRWHRR